MFVASLALALSVVFPGAERCDVPVASAPSVQATADSTLAQAYAAGVTWDAFLSSARARRDAWLRHWTEAQVPADVLAEARRVSGRWRLLVIAVDSCSDSVNTIPYLARLVADVPELEMRIVSPRAGRALMAARPTPDGRPATPTVILLDEAGAEAGCWIERPRALQDIALAAKAGGGTPEFAAAKQRWYDEDAGESTLREVVALLRAAEAGARGCDAAGDSRG